MAVTIRTRRGTGVPANGELAYGELAVDTTNANLYVGDDTMPDSIPVLLTGNGGGGGPFIPLAGTSDPDYITGDLVWEHSTNDKRFAIGIAEGVFDEALTIAATQAGTGGDLILSTWDGAASVPFFFQRSGQLQLPDIDYSAANGLSAVNKNYVDSVAGGGDFIPLSGTVGPDWITGDLVWEHSTNSKRFGIGIAEGIFDEALTIAATQAGTGGDLILSTWDGASSVNFFFQRSGELQLPDIDYSLVNGLSAVNKNYVDSVAGGGGLPPGNATHDTIRWDGANWVPNSDLSVNPGVAVNVDSVLTVNDPTPIANTIMHVSNGGNASLYAYFECNVSAFGQVAAVGNLLTQSQCIIEAAAPTAANHATRKSYVDGLNNTNVKTSGNQNISGTKTFTTALVATNIVGNEITNLTMNGFVTIPALAGGGNRAVMCDNNGTLYGA